ncbi:MAG: UPF0182 family protein [Cyanobacteriota bacterium]|nr:UPF0182 family protein [Cyanobacteriota bacterium]
MGSQPRRWLRVGLWLLATLLLAGLAWDRLSALLIEFSWFEELGYASTLALGVGARAFVGLLAFGLGAWVWWANLRPLWPEKRPGLGTLILLLAGGFAVILARQWFTVMAWIDQVEVGIQDPIFGRDISFFLFSLPFWQMLQSWCFSLLVILLVIVGIGYLTQWGFGKRRLQFALPLPAQRHLILLGGSLFAIVAWRHWLNRYELLYSPRGANYGASYTDIHAQLPAETFLAGVALLNAIGFAWIALRQINPQIVRFKFKCRPWVWCLIAPAVLAVSYGLLAELTGDIYPEFVQSVFVAPNELERERPYIEHTIRFTRQAFNLEHVQVQPFQDLGQLTAQDIQANDPTIKNIRLWDPDPLLAAYRQLQEIRPYYQFPFVDVDRYRIGGELRQVMHSARELDYQRVPEPAQTWINQRFFYTHGYGLALSPVNVVTSEGLPAFFISDLPPKSVNSLVDEAMTIRNPAIYYGELTDTDIFVGTSARELDYPEADEYIYSNYQGSGGVPVPHLWQRLMFAWHFRDLRILISREFRPETKFLFRRQIRERVQHLAPFLDYDADPYLVISQGKLYWILDAYTLTNYYPYSEPAASLHAFNYIRNSVKVIIDAYDGSVDFYVVDEGDPLIRTYQHIFPDLFHRFAEMPDDLKNHLRYPQDLFRIQTQQYATYHMVDPQIFYNREDLWQIPNQYRHEKLQPMQPQYLILTLPELPNAQNEPEFVLLSQFTPFSKQNMIAWMAARCDGEHYGQLVVYEFSRQRLIYGPEQVEARINQNPEISEQISLWSEHGSRVNYGTLLVIPIQNALLYIQPLFLEAERDRLPQLTRILAAYEERITMQSTLNQVLEKLFSPTQGSPDSSHSPDSASD